MYEKTCVKHTQSDRSPRSILRSQANYRYDKGSGGRAYLRRANWRQCFDLLELENVAVGLELFHVVNRD